MQYTQNCSSIYDQEGKCCMAAYTASLGTQVKLQKPDAD